MTSKKQSKKKSKVKKKDPNKLNAQQTRFKNEYLKDFNGTQAAIRAGYAPLNARITASKLLTKSNIQHAIQKRKEKLSLKAEIDQEWLLKRYKMLSDYCMDDFVNNDGTMKSLKNIPKDKLYAIEGFKQSKKIILQNDDELITERIKEFKLPNKRPVLDSIAKYIGGMFEKDTTQQGQLAIENLNVQINLND